MHNDHIGDSLDAAKSFILASLALSGINACLIPLPSHDDFDYQLFTRCVSPWDPSRIYRSSNNYTYRNHSRKDYLDELFDWFLAEGSSIHAVIFDPDTGIRRDRDTNKFFGISGLTRFLHDHPRCVIGVYQHRNTGGLSFEKSLSLVSAELGFGYDFGSAAILFWANEPARQTFERTQRIFIDSLNEKRLVFRSA